MLKKGILDKAASANLPIVSMAVVRSASWLAAPSGTFLQVLEGILVCLLDLPVLLGQGLDLLADAAQCFQFIGNGFGELGNLFQGLL